MLYIPTLIQVAVYGRVMQSSVNELWVSIVLEVTAVLFELFEYKVGDGSRKQIHIKFH